MTTLAYRRDIDGLRAIAVLAVVLFHFGVPGITGGFVGVDVFFVISGFLITSIIWRERQAGRFSFIDFWARRARRILPALFVMIAATLAVGWFLLAPKDYEELGRSAHYQVTFTSNLLFSRQHGYFDASSDIKPLLHTWSLAVEEQFYIFFPLLLALLSSRLKHWRLALFAVLLVSFGMSVWAVQHEPQKAFFLLHLRAWELLAGAMLAVQPKREWRASPALAQGVSLASLALILIAVLGYDAKTPFPGATALLPVLGVVGLIWANGQQPTWVARLLGTRIMVGIGLISYSWYLWHWPVFVYANYAAVDGLSALELAGLMLLSLVLGYLSWRFVETPFRENVCWSRVRRFWLRRWSAFWGWVSLAWRSVNSTACLRACPNRRCALPRPRSGARTCWRAWPTKIRPMNACSAISAPKASRFQRWYGVTATPPR